VALLALKTWKGYFGTNINVGEQRLEMHIRSRFTVVNLQDFWINNPR